MDTSHISVLIVDDEALNRDIFGHALKKAGYHTHSVGNGVKAIEHLKVEKCDIVLLDINMPELNGIQVLEQIKTNPVIRDIPVMMITAEHDNDTVVRCIKLGAADYIKKPIEPALLRSRLWRCLQKYKSISDSEADGTSAAQKTRAHILIVDDDEMHRAIVKRRLSAEDHIIIEAQNGKEAIAALDKDKFDLILLDVTMPEMDGFQTLQRIKSSEVNRQIPVLMCSADDNPATIEKCLKAGAVDYILKPFNASLLSARVQSCLLVDKSGLVQSSVQPNVPDIIIDLAERLKSNRIQFPIMPDIAIQIDKLFKEKEDIDINEISEIIKSDPALTMRLISISNSAYYRGAMSIKTLEEAIMRLGMKETQNYLLLLTTKSLFASDTAPFNKFLDRLWIHSIATAEASRQLGKLLDYPDLNHLFTLGMLHDMGKMLLLQVLFELHKNDRDMDEANIMEVVDAQHMAFGATLMRKWNLPSEFSYTAEQHHTIAEGGKYSQPFLIVCLANQITRILGYSLKEDTGDDLTQTYPARELGIDTEAIDKVCDGTKLFVSNMRNLA
jgi:putative nucleotidyltransferase with HDIG domain